MISIDFKLVQRDYGTLQLHMDKAVKMSSSVFPVAILTFTVNGVNMGNYHGSSQETPILAFGTGLIYILNCIQPDGDHLLWHEDGAGGDLQFQRNGTDTITLSDYYDNEVTCDFAELRNAAECFGKVLLAYFEDNFPVYVRAHPYLKERLTAVNTLG